jgi:thioredoxin-like negative regulator of GroEL
LMFSSSNFCQVCKQLDDIMQEMEVLFRNTSTSVAKIEATSSPYLVRRLMIEELPTVLYIDAKQVRTYPGEIELQPLLKFAK